MSEDTNSIVRYKLNAGESTFTVQAFAEGFLSSFGHDPTIGIVDFRGEAEFNPNGITDGKLWIEVDATTITVLSLIPLSNRVVTSEEKERDRQDTEDTMHNEILQSYRYPTIFFESTEITATKIIEGRFYKAKVVGDLTFHGVTRKGLWLMAHITLMDDDKMQTKGYFSLKQSDYEVELIKVAGGALKVQDEVKFDFYLTFHKEAVVVPQVVVPQPEEAMAFVPEIVLPSRSEYATESINFEKAESVTEPATEPAYEFPTEPSIEHPIAETAEIYDEEIIESSPEAESVIQEAPVIESTEEVPVMERQDEIPTQNDIWAEGWRELASEIRTQDSIKTSPEESPEVRDVTEAVSPIAEELKRWDELPPRIVNPTEFDSWYDEEIHITQEDETEDLSLDETEDLELDETEDLRLDETEDLRLDENQRYSFGEPPLETGYEEERQEQQNQERIETPEQSQERVQILEQNQEETQTPNNSEMESWGEERIENRWVKDEDEIENRNKWINDDDEIK